MTSLLQHYLSLTLLFLVSVNCQLEDDWITTIETLPQDVEFNCSSPLQTPPPGAFPELWMFPDLTNVGLNYTDGRRMVVNNGMRLMIKNATVDDFGIYHCMMLYPTNSTEDSNVEIMEWYLIKVGLNIKGPYFEDLWQKYKTGTIIGTSACLSFLLASIMIWVVAKHKWIAPPGFYTEEESTATNGNIEGVDNQAFTADETHSYPSSYVPASESDVRRRDNGSVTVHHKSNQPEQENVKNGSVVNGDQMITEL